MQWQILYPDMSDVGEFRAWRNISKQFLNYENYVRCASLKDALAKLNELIPTELGIATTNTCGDRENDALMAAGWTPIQKRINWSPWECGDTTVILWVKQFPGRGLAQPVESPKTFKDTKDRSYFCCGLKIIGASRVPKPSKTFWVRRYRREPNAARMARAGYSLIARTSVATYWANGWAPSAHDYDVELDYIKKHVSKRRRPTPPTALVP